MCSFSKFYFYFSLTKSNDIYQTELPHFGPINLIFSDLPTKIPFSLVDLPLLKKHKFKQMKYLSIAIVSAFLFLGCVEEKSGNLRQQIRCTNEQNMTKPKSIKSSQDNKYTQFGNFITSLTPSSFIGEIEVVRYSAENESGSFMTLVHREPNQGEEVFLADFSNNITLNVIPTLNGSNIMENSDGQGQYFKNNVTFKLLWIRMGLRQKIELPIEYSKIKLNQFYNNQKVNNVITTDVIPLFQAVDELIPFGKTFTIYFGMTDSTYAEYHEIFNGNATLPYIRSSKFNEWTMTPPLSEQTKTMISTIGFYNKDIIQVYAGADNIPYTSDDVIVLEPRFWERIYVNVNET